MMISYKRLFMNSCNDYNAITYIVLFLIRLTPKYATFPSCCLFLRYQSEENLG